MEKELTSAEKARKTKLSNKTIDELVEIVFRKDNVEKRLQRLNKCLKDNVFGLENKCKNINEELIKSEEEVLRLNNLVNQLEEDTKIQELTISKLKREIKVINISWILGIVIAWIILILVIKFLF